MRFRHLITIVLFLSVSACSSKLAYNNLDWLSYWYVSDYIDLTDDQSTAVKDRLRVIHQWHRRDQLPRYEARLNTLKQEIEADRISPVSVATAMAFIRDSWFQLRGQVVSSAMDLLPTLSSVQAEELFANLAEKNKSDLAELSKETDKRFEYRYEKLEELIEDYLGQVTDQQKLILELYIGSSFDTKQAYLEGNQRMQADLKAEVLAYIKQPSQNLLETIRKKLNQPDKYRSNEYKLYVAENRKLVSVMLSDLAVTLTADQKVFLINKIQDWIRLTEELKPE